MNRSIVLVLSAAAVALMALVMIFTARKAARLHEQISALEKQNEEEISRANAAKVAELAEAREQLRLANGGGWRRATQEESPLG